MEKGLDGDFADINNLLVSGTHGSFYGVSNMVIDDSDGSIYLTGGFEPSVQAFGVRFIDTSMVYKLTQVESVSEPPLFLIYLSGLVGLIGLRKFK